MQLWPLIDVRFSFPPNIFRKNGQNEVNFVHALILTRSRLGLLPICVMLPIWLMSEFRLRSISLEQMDKPSSYFVYVLILTRSRLGMLPVISQICSRVVSLD